MTRWPLTCSMMLLATAGFSEPRAQQGMLPPEAAQVSEPAQPTPAPPATNTVDTAQPPVVAETTTVTENDEPDVEKGYSYGTASYSLMFTTEQVEAMKNVLAGVEMQSDKATPAAVTSSTQDISPFLAKTPKVQGEPQTYPVFYMSSIVYRSPSDWAIWLANQRITPKNNKGQLEVVSVSPSAVTFHWKPDYMSSLARRQQEKKFTPVDGLKNRLTDKETVFFNEKDRLISFTLRPNQSFSAAHMSTFEGQVAPVTMSSIDVVTPMPNSGSKLDGAAKALLNDLAGEMPAAEDAAPAASSAMDSKTADTLQELLKNQKNFMAASPRSSPLGQQPQNAPPSGN